MTATGDRRKIIVFGIMFWYPLAGVTYQFLHYLLGLQALGHDVYYVEDSGRWIYDPALNDLSPDAGPNVDAVAPILEAHGFAGRWCFRGNYEGGSCYGLDETALSKLYREADAFLNVTAAQELREEHLSIPQRIYVESDPFPAQVLAHQGDESVRETLAQHTALFTFGENVGTSQCMLPVNGYTWQPTRQPVHLDLWRGRQIDPVLPLTTITTWHNKGKDLEFDGETYFWTKDREFQRYLDLPSHRPGCFELAVGAGQETFDLLAAHGWATRHSWAVSRDVRQYRDFIRASRGEFTVARDQYVRPRTGWFSDRSACYLAAGRPVITEDTGFGSALPTGAGLFPFSDIEDVLSAVDAIAGDYSGQCKAAADIAAEFFAADKVLDSLLSRAGS